jgi:hypothetical protein
VGDDDRDDRRGDVARLVGDVHGRVAIGGVGLHGGFSR